MLVSTEHTKLSPRYILNKNDNIHRNGKEGTTRGSVILHKYIKLFHQ